MSQLGCKKWVGESFCSVLSFPKCRIRLSKPSSPPQEAQKKSRAIPPLPPPPSRCSCFRHPPSHHFSRNGQAMYTTTFTPSPLRPAQARAVNKPEHRKSGMKSQCQESRQEAFILQRAQKTLAASESAVQERVLEGRKVGPCDSRDTLRYRDKGVQQGQDSLYSYISAPCNPLSRGQRVQAVKWDKVCNTPMETKPAKRKAGFDTALGFAINASAS